MGHPSIPAAPAVPPAPPPAPTPVDPAIVAAAQAYRNNAASLAAASNPGFSLPPAQTGGKSLLGQ